MDEFLDDDAGYQQWLAGHPVGFVVNSYAHPTPSYLVLHRATCWTINGLAGAGNALTSYRKTCFRTRRQASDWAEGRWPGRLRRCGHCRA